jgi:hypothetical protein
MADMTSPDDITTNKTVAEMVTVANEYCVYLETAENKSREGILRFAVTILPLLYLKGSLLPGVEVENPEANERFVTEEQWESVFTLLREKILDEDEFWLIDPLHVNETEPLRASISENLADIYQDMKDFVLLYQKNTLAARQNALADCKELFNTHWGYRISNVMPRLHHLNNRKKDPELFESLDIF